MFASLSRPARHFGTVTEPDTSVTFRSQDMRDTRGPNGLSRGCKVFCSTDNDWSGLTLSLLRAVGGVMRSIADCFELGQAKREPWGAARLPQVVASQRFLASHSTRDSSKSAARRLPSGSRAVNLTR